MSKQNEQQRNQRSERERRRAWENRPNDTLRVSKGVPATVIHSHVFFAGQFHSDLKQKKKKTIQVTVSDHSNTQPVKLKSTRTAGNGHCPPLAARPFPILAKRLDSSFSSSCTQQQQHANTGLRPRQGQSRAAKGKTNRGEGFRVRARQQQRNSIGVVHAWRVLPHNMQRATRMCCTKQTLPFFILRSCRTQSTSL